VIVVHQVYNNHTTPLHKGWAPYTVGPTPCKGVLYDCCTLSVQLSLFKIEISPGMTRRTAGLSSQRWFWYWAPTRESYTITIPTCSDSVSHPQTLSSSLSTSSESPVRQTYIKRKLILSIYSANRENKKLQHNKFCECLEYGGCA
jgi:hypothetical protein